MKLKTTQIIKKLMPSSKNFRVRVKNQRKLSKELTRRVWWKFNVIEYCDNKDEFNSSVLKIKVILIGETPAVYGFHLRNTFLRIFRS